MADIRIGISGWSYAKWRNSFYPDDLPKKKDLEYASRQFTSIEVNGSFYSLFSPGTWRRYYEETPPGFLFAVKGSRFITHIKQLRDIRGPLANFLASGILELKEKLGPILWQFPARHLAPERFGDFLDLLPKNTAAASRLAHDHDQRVSGRASLSIDRNRRLRHALEIRDPNALTPAFVRLLRRHGVALVFSDSGKWPYFEEITAGFVFLRLHGSPQTYASRYSDADLDRWAGKIRLWTSGQEPAEAARITDRIPPRRKTRDAYVYFDNDAEGHAPRDALRLMERLSVTSGDRD